MAEKQCNLLKNGGGMTTVRFPDYSRLITSIDNEWSAQGLTYTATEDCWVRCAFLFKSATFNHLDIDGVTVFMTTLRYTPSNTDAEHDTFIPMKKGSVLTTRTGNTDTRVVLFVYGML